MPTGHGSLCVSLGLAAALASSSCGPRRTVPLRAGIYVDEGAVELTLDLEANLARVRGSTSEVELKLLRIEDPRTWPTDCGTMTGPARVELAKIDPPGFSLDGVVYPFDGVRAGCGASLELVESGSSHTWRFTARP